MPMSIPALPRPTLGRSLAAALLLAAIACSGGDATAPSIGPTLSPAPSHAAAPQGQSASALGQLVACSRREPVTGSAVIGPRGGVVVAGRNTLIVPPGALREPVLITATVSADTVALVRFAPHGLQFRTPAGLVLDSEGCGIPDGAAPAVVYVDDAGTVLERIEAYFSPRWHAVAAPIEHFSGYAIAF
jgi:hypothetical protein